MSQIGHAREPTLKQDDRSLSGAGTHMAHSDHRAIGSDHGETFPQLACPGTMLVRVMVAFQG